MELVTLAILGMILVVPEIVAKIVEQYQARKTMKEEADSLRQSLEQYASTYSFEDADIPMIEACRDYLSRRFPDGIESSFNQLETLEEREQFAREIIGELASCMNVKVSSIEFSNMSVELYGQAVPNNDGACKICLNRAVLVADPRQFVKTICHELRHVVQYKSFTENTWGHSPARVAQWLYSWNNYVSCTSATNYLAYSSQIIEVDANKYADELFKDLNM